MNTRVEIGHLASQIQANMTHYINLCIMSHYTGLRQQQIISLGCFGFNLKPRFLSFADICELLPFCYCQITFIIVDTTT